MRERHECHPNKQQKEQTKHSCHWSKIPTFNNTESLWLPPQNFALMTHFRASKDQDHRCTLSSNHHRSKEGHGEHLQPKNKKNPINRNCFFWNEIGVLWISPRTLPKTKHLFVGRKQLIVFHLPNCLCFLSKRSRLSSKTSLILSCLLGRILQNSKKHFALFTGISEKLLKQCRQWQEQNDIRLVWFLISHRSNTTAARLENDFRVTQMILSFDK